MDFPRTDAQITAEWLTSVLRDCGAILKASVTSVELENNGDSKGAWSVVNRIVLDYDAPEPDAPGSVVAKTVLQSEMVLQNQDFRRGVARINERESRFYQQLATDCGLGTPKHYFSSYDMETAEVIYLLEDAGHLRAVDRSRVHRWQCCRGDSEAGRTWWVWDLAGDGVRMGIIRAVA